MKTAAQHREAAAQHREAAAAARENLRRLQTQTPAPDVLNREEIERDAIEAHEAAAAALDAAAAAQHEARNGRAALELIYSETGIQRKSESDAPGATIRAATEAATLIRELLKDRDTMRRAYQNADRRAGSLERELSKCRAALDYIETRTMDAGDVTSPPECYEQRAEDIMQPVRALYDTITGLQERLEQRAHESDRLSDAARQATARAQDERQSRARAEKAADIYRRALTYIAAIPGNADPATLEDVNGINDGRDRGIRLCGAVQVAREAITRADADA